ncbi:efflux RND transporter permease subunit [Parahaliea aestuarii]|uniref:Efflux RND transporter permease subunit n=1 Tax=Parahaliea aestuarii TaxID=1852021 RepID=A0A5C8ZQG2_9GAMM|nr:efflux RND transporter permease subunit [Parahaliea aestuarii]TXS89737.1 efflux RND transporter permease subunit [Parahaliea aestuarii]
MQDSQPVPQGIIAWFARNPVAANLLMIIIMVVGLGSAFTIQRAMFPAFDLEVVFINMSYPGAPPEEVEQGIVLKIEEAINDVDGIKRVESDALESHARVMIEPLEGTDLNKLMDDVKNRIDAILFFPEEAEKPIISQPELLFPAVTLQLSGELGERSMKTLAEEVRRELLTYPEVSAATIVGAREYEISIEISEQLLREYHLSLGEVADIISSSSLDLPAGSVRTEHGDIALRTLGQAYVQQDFEDIVLRTNADGTRLMLGDIATVKDEFEEAEGFALFNNRYSLGIQVYAMGEQDIIDTARVTREYLEEKNRTLADNVTLEPWSDITFYLEGRLGMMFSNLAMGALLVFLVLALFLEIKLAFWVMLGIPVCFLGAMAMINTPYIHASLNMISIFGFILVLGIVVDDAIIMGESAYAETERHGHSVDNVIRGVYQVATPATFGVLTTIVAFAPTLFVDGMFAAMPAACGWVVILCLVFSLVESKWILPAHLAHSKPTRNRLLLYIDHRQEAINGWLKTFIDQRYTPFVARCVRNRYLTLATFISGLILCAGLLAGGVVRTVLAPDVPGEFLHADVTMSEGSPEERTLEAIQTVVKALEEVEAEHKRSHGGEELVKHIFAYGASRVSGGIDVELTKENQRSISTREIERRWREKIGYIHGTEVLAISSADGPEFGPSIAFDLMHSNFETLRAASQELEEALRHYEGLYDIRNGASDTRDEFHIDILPEGEALGLTRFDLATQVRHAFYGAEAQRIQRGIDEIRVMVRYPRADRETVSSLHDMFIRTPDGSEVPFGTVARLRVEQGLLKATHINYQRAAEVTAEANKDLVEPSRVMADIQQRVMPGLVEKYPGLRWAVSGLAEEEAKMGRSMLIGFSLALFGIYALLAVPTRSYLQPLIIMGVIPFGVIGAVVGHWITGYPLSMMSLMGVIALSGVVVNDSLILVDYINKAVRDGVAPLQAVMDAGTRRFRAILLTSLTTFFGLAPMLLERSAQAQEIVPMAVSLAFGIVFATVITLLLVPSLYMILDDLAQWNQRREQAALEAGASTGH